MATISTVAVDFVANTAKFLQGLAGIDNSVKKFAGNTKAQTRQVEDSFKNLERSVDRFQSRLLGLATITVVARYVSRLTNEVSTLVDEAEKVGASAGQFDALRLAAQRNGASLESVKKGYVEIQKSVNEAVKGSKGASSAFRELNLSLEGLLAAKPDQRFLQIADALSKVSDENRRAALGTEILGKAYTELAPLIAGGAAGIRAAGRGSLSTEQLKQLDTVNKQFEEFSRVIDTQLKTAILSISEQLIAIVNAGKFVIENFRSIATVAAIAFSPLILLKFASILGQVSAKAAEVGIKIAQAANTAKFLGGINPFEKFLGSLTPAVPLLTSVRTATAALSAAVGALAIALGKFILIAVGFIGGLLAVIKTFQLLNNLFADFLLLLDPKNLQAQELRQRAKDYADAYDVIVDGLKSLVDFRKDETKVVEATTKAERDAAAAARQSTLEKEKQKLAIQKLKEETDAYIKTLEELGKKTNESTRTSFEAARDEFEQLINALDVGPLKIEAFRRRVDELKGSLDAIDLERLRLEFGDGPFGVLAEQIDDATAAAKRFAQEEIFGKGTVPTIGLPKGARPFDTTPSQDFAKQEQQRLTSLADTLKKDAMTAEEVYAQRVIDINTAAAATDQYGRELLTVEQQTYGLVQAQKELDNATMEVWKKANPEILLAFEYMSSFADQFARAITEGQNFGEALKNVFKSILRDITVLIIRSAILQGIMASLGFINPAAGAAFGQLTGLVSAGNRADGGSVMGGSPYRVGERGPETFVPAENGYILPNDMPSGETVIVNQTINVQTGVAQTVRAEMISLLPRFKSEAMAGVLDAKQRGGSYAKGLSPA